MITPGARVTVGALATIALAIARPSAQIYRATSNAVSVDVSVRSGSKSVKGLNANDFKLSDNGVPQQVQVVLTESLPLDVSLVLDVSGSVRGPLLGRLRTAVEDVARRLDTKDRLRLLLVSQSVREVFDFHEGGAVPLLSGLVAGGTTSLYDGVIAALIKTRPVDRRHLIVAFTDGRDTSSFFDTQTAREIALQTDGVVHFVIGNAGVPNVFDRERARVNELAATTGGEILPIDISSSISDAFKRVIDDFRTGYVLRYTPQSVALEGWHRIDVQITRAGNYDVRARKQYFGG